MKKIFSTLLATLLILSSFSFSAFTSFAAEDEIILQASEITGVLASFGVNAAAKTQLLTGENAPNGITAVKINADPCEDRDPKYSSECAAVLECYPTGKGIKPQSYKYARMTYMYIPADGDENVYTPHFEFKTTASGFKSHKGTALEANKWAYMEFDFSSVDYTADEVINQFRIYAFGSAVGTLDYDGGKLDSSKHTVVDPDSSLYIANIAFFTEKPAAPTITGISFSSATASVTRGKSVTLPKVTVEGTGSPITSYDIVLTGHTSNGTKLSEDGNVLYAGADEKSDTITLTATSVVDKNISATLIINVENPKPRSKFDADNVVLSFGVVSDVHFSGSWNQPRSKAKGSHVIDIFQNLGADAILYNGDITDAVNSAGNVNGDGLHTSKSQYGTKAEQNYREVGYFAQSLWGADEGGFGNGVNDTTKIFYALGNHDEGGTGKASCSKSGITYTTVYSAEYFAAVICGWQYDATSDAAQAVADGMEDSYRSYIKDLLDYNTNTATTVTADAFEAKYGVTLSSADAKFDKYFGHDSEYSLGNEYGLFYGNRHMTLDPDGVKDNDFTDDIHFIAMELSQSSASITWAEKIIQQSISENPNKPIFVISHYKAAGTSVIGSYSIDRLANLLEKYPQTFQWGGHNHSFLHSDRAIDTSNGYVATDSAVTAYASMYNLTNSNMFGFNSGTEKYAFNASTKENHAYGNGAFVEVDKNFNVRINRVDLYRSYSADYAENTSLYSSGEFTNFKSNSYSDPVDEAVFIRTPWDITDIGPEGIHLQDYTTARFEQSEKPSFASADSLKVVSGKIGAIPVTITLDATDDGMVYMYLLELTEKDSDEVLQRYYFTNKFYNYPDGNIPEITIDHTFAGLSPNKTYTVIFTPVDDLMNKGTALTADATTLDGDTKVTLEDGTTAIFVDTTGKTALYEWTDGKNYLVYSSMAEALAAKADIMYIIECDTQLYCTTDGKNYTQELLNIKSGTKIIGLNRDKAIFRYNASYTLGKDMWFENVSLAKEKNYKGSVGDEGITLQGHTLTLIDVNVSANPINIFNTGWGKTDPSGTLVIKGDTGIVENIYPGPNFGDGVGSKGDVNITLEGGTYVSVGSVKARPNNKIDGNVYITVNGGTYDSIKASHTSENHNITKNAVLKLLGGTFTTVGITGTTNVDGKDIVVMTSAVKDSIKTLNKAGNQIHIIIPDNVTDAVGDATVDENGYITSYAIKQIEGKKSFVDGTPATTFAVENGKTYEITYKTPNTIDFDLNGGEGNVPASITGNAGDDVTSQMPDGTGVNKDNYTFRGWSVNKDAVDPDTSFVISADGTVVYAVWKAKEKVKLTLNANGGTVSEESIEIFCDSDTELPTAYKEKSVFLGWAESADAAEGTFNVTIPAGTNEKTLYAIYKEVGMDVIYVDVNATTNGDGRTSRTPMNDWIAAMKSGSSEGTMYVFMSTAVVSEDATVSKSFKYAKGALWLTNIDPATGEKYDVAAILKKNGHYTDKAVTWDMPIASLDHTGMHMNAQGNALKFTENAIFIATDAIIPGTTDKCSSVPYIRGAADGGSGDTSVNKQISEISFDNLDLVQNVTVYVGNQFGSTVANANIIINGGTVSKAFNMGGGLATIANVIINGYSTEAEISIDKAGNCGTVNYILNNDTADKVTVPTGENIYVIKSVSGGEVVPTATAGTFEIVSTTGEIYVNNVKQTISSDNTYALGEAGTYIITYDNLARNEVTYDLNGVNGTAPESYTAKENDEVILPELNIDVEGLTFIGWNTDKNATEALENVIMGKDALTLYAIYERATYEVSFNAGIGNAIGELEAVTKTYGVDLTLPTDYVLYGTGLEFVGWAENPDATADDVVTVYTENAATTFFAIYNVTEDNVTPETSDEDLAEGLYFTFAESDMDVSAPEFDIPGTVSEIAKVEIKLMDAATNTAVQPTEPHTFTIHCDTDLSGKAVYVYHVETAEFEDCTVNGNDVTFTADSFSTFVIYTVEVEASYILKGQYNLVTGIYTVSLYYNGEKANSGSFGFAFDNTVYTFDNFAYAEGFDAVTDTAYDEVNATISGTWYPATGAYIGGDDKDYLIGTFTFTCANEDYDKALAADRFFEFNIGSAVDEIFDGTYYLYAKNSTSDLGVTFAPIVTLALVDNEPISVTYKVAGNLVTVREDGNAPLSYATATVTTENGTKVAEFAVEDADTATGTVAFEFETAPGNYNITVIKNGYLETTTAFEVVDADVVLDDIAPVAGDIRSNVADAQGDGEINLADFVRIIRGFEYAELAPHVDINEDGAVNVTDLAFVKANFGAKK